MHLEPRAQRNGITERVAFPFHREIVTSEKDIRYRTLVDCDRLNNTVLVHSRWCTVSALCTSWLPSRSCSQALPLILPYVSLFRHRQAGFVARNDKSVLFDEHAPPPSRAEFIIMFCTYVSLPDALAATIRHFRKATDAFPVRPSDNEDTEPHSLRHTTRVCEVNIFVFTFE